VAYAIHFESADRTDPPARVREGGKESLVPVPMTSLVSIDSKGSRTSSEIWNHSVALKNRYYKLSMLMTSEFVF